MGNCLVTRLKGVVNNDNLKKLGELVITVSSKAAGTSLSDAERNIGMSFSNYEQVKITAEGNLISGQKEIIPESGFRAYVCPEGEYKIHIENGAYNIRAIGINTNTAKSNFFSINLDDLEYADLTLLQVSRYATYGELKHVNDNITNIEISDYTSPVNNRCWLNTEILKNAMNYTGLYLYERYNGEDEHSYGDITNIKSTVLNNLFINNTKITGDLYTMVKNMVDNGRTSGTLYMQGNALITYKGTPFIEWRNSLGSSGGGVRFTFTNSNPEGFTVVRAD